MGTKDKKKTVTEVEIGEYKGNAMFIIHTLDAKGERKPYPFQFGMTKAESIVNHLKELESFVKTGEIV